ncbi:MAG TPA: hypothetical protein VI383_01305 [Gemmatimonadales bacterium]|nr:hypothetical protein [Gemmatimonadales bacterium]
MDRQALALLIPIMALAIPVAAIIFGSLVKMARLKAGAERSELLNPAIESRLLAVEDEVASLRRELVDTQERLDFTERLLSAKSRPEPDR